MSNSSIIDTVAQLKQAGNAAFSKGEISNATELYTRAIELAKSTEPGTIDPALYSNRAACRLKASNWPAAVHDCDAGIRLITSLSDNSPSSVNVGVQSKLYFRKATALEAERVPGARDSNLRGRCEGACHYRQTAPAGADGFQNTASSNNGD